MPTKENEMIKHVNEEKSFPTLNSKYCISFDTYTVTIYFHFLYLKMNDLRQKPLCCVLPKAKLREKEKGKRTRLQSVCERG